MNSGLGSVECIIRNCRLTLPAELHGSKALLHTDFPGIGSGLRFGVSVWPRNPAKCFNFSWFLALQIGRTDSCFRENYELKAEGAVENSSECFRVFEKPLKGLGGVGDLGLMA